MSKPQGPDEIQVLMKEIIVGFKAKLIKPILCENERLYKKIEDLEEKDKAQFQELKEKLQLLEQKIDQSPVLILEAIRNAIEQTGES
ncbi:hypothetical protein [Desulfolucanica intricata]|uniref:hypothetical protein n=1 Tax=Desulfolucanica intricata TaxID=1285191 RepID=UPI0008304084|nr:hypothetical protein [Desulfolucanica intricata]